MNNNKSNLRSTACVLIVCLTSWAFSPAITGCSGGSDLAGSPEVASSQKNTLYYVDDHLGSSYLITDEAGDVLNEQVTYPYGLTGTVSQTGYAGSDFNYTTKERDEETGLIYFGSRYYSPEMGRWITPDSLFLEKPSYILKRPLEGNLYSYVKGNPVRYVDADGSFAWDVTIDVGFFAYGLQQYFGNPSLENGINLVLDTAGLLPAVPALGAIKRGICKAGESIERLEPTVQFMDVGKFGQYKATWVNNREAVAIFEPLADTGVKVSYLNRGSYAKGSGGSMLADAFKDSLLFQPEHIVFHNVIEKRTLEQLGRGLNVEDTLLGRTMRNTVDELGGEISSMRFEPFQGKPSIVGDVDYKYIK